MFEAEEAAQRHPDQEHLNKIFEFRDPEPEQLKDISEEAAQMDPEQEQLNDGLPERKPLRVIYWKYLRTRRRIAALEVQFRDYNNIDLLIPLDVFRPHTDPAGALEELDMLRTILDGQRTNILSLAELWSSRIPKRTD